MILKNREKPEKMLKLEALLNRLPTNHCRRTKVEQDLARINAGYRGEGSLDYYLSFLDEKEYFILHNVRLTNKTYSFQIDTLILTPYFILIIEVKNLSGTILIDSVFRQLIRTMNGTENYFPHPEDQTYHQRIQLLHWLQHHKLPILPIEILVVFANQNCILKSDDSYPKTNQSSSIIRSTSLLTKIEQIEIKHTKEYLSKKEIRKIASLINKHHASHTLDILLTYQIDRKELIFGVQCPECTVYFMLRKQGKWYCPVCGTTSIHAHLQALQDYSLIVGSFISNKEIREFLCISSTSIARKLMKSSNIPSVGSTKDKQYQL